MRPFLVVRYCCSRLVGLCTIEFKVGVEEVELAPFGSGDLTEDPLLYKILNEFVGCRGGNADGTGRATPDSGSGLVTSFPSDQRMGTKFSSVSSL